MNIFYDKDTDYAEVFFSKEANYGDVCAKDIMAFKSEQTDKIVGYGFDLARSTLFKATFLSASVKLAALLKIIRTRENLTQTEAADRIGHITMRHFQRLEAGEDNPTLSTIESLMAAFPAYDFSQILRSPKTA